MTTARIADIALATWSPDVDFGSLLDGSGRAVSFPTTITGATKDAVALAVARLNARLAEPCDLVLESAGSAYPQALHLLGDGSARITDHVAFELGYQARVTITAPCAPYATPANRVYLAAPIGDEFPSDTAVVRATSDAGGVAASYVYADSGRWAVAADATRSGVLTLSGDCTAGETLVVETVLDYATKAASAFRAALTWYTSAGVAIGTDTPLVVYADAAGRKRCLVVLRVPATAASFAIVLSHATPTGTCLAYVESIEVGTRLPATPLLGLVNVLAPDIGWSSDAFPDHDYSYNTVTGCTWSYAGRYLTAACVASGGEAILQTVNALAVRPGQRVGLYAKSQVTAYTSGSIELRIYWYDSANNFIYSSGVRAAFAADGAVVLTVAEATAPAHAAFARACAVVTSGSTLTYKVSCLHLSTGIVEAPAAVGLDGIIGEVAAPLELLGDVDPESDAHAVWAAVGSGDQPYTVEAEALAWTGGTTAYSTDAALYPGTGNTGRQNAGVSAATAPVDTSGYRPGTYLLLVRALTNNASYAATLTCAENDGTATTTSTTPVWLSLGQVVLPTKRTHPGTAANLTLGMVSDDASGVVTVDRYAFVPLTQGGCVSYQDSTPADGVSQFDVAEDGTVLLDGAVDLTDCVGGQLLATARDRLIVCAEEAASDETTHLVNLTALHRPRFDLFRG